MAELESQHISLETLLGRVIAKFSLVFLLQLFELEVASFFFCRVSKDG